MAGNSALEYCDPAFVQSWIQVEKARPLFAGFIDAMALVGYDPEGKLRVVLEGPGFTDLFGTDYASEIVDFSFLADRQDRGELLNACEAAKTVKGPIRIEIAWAVGNGVHADDAGNFFQAVVGIEHVGRIGVGGDVASPDDELRAGHGACANGTELLYFAFKDISARHDAESRMTRSQLSSALRALFDEMFLLDLDTGTSEPIYAAGRSLTNEDGTPIESGFHAMYKTVHRDDIGLFWKCSNYTHVEAQLFGDTPSDAITFDVRRNRGDGDYHWERIYISRVASGGKHNNVLVCCQNIDEQKDAQRRERELLSKAQHDSLTGVYNRGTSDELIHAKLQGMATGETAAFAIVDVDDFKRVNDTYGHAAGDKLLRAVADALRGACCEEDVVGRMGGDEFVVLFSDTSPANQQDLAIKLERCKASVSAESVALGINPPVTLSIGVVWVSADDSTYHESFEQADCLLYEAKRSGKNALRFG